MSAHLDVLLEVQAHDLVIDQLRHRRERLAERQALREAAHEATGVDRQLADARARGRDLARRQRRLEDEVDTLAAKRAGTEGRLYGGTVQAPRELEALSQEVEALARRTRGLEDELLELMEAGEPIAAEAGALEARRQELATEADRLAAVVAEREAEIDRLVAVAVAARGEAAGGVPPALLATYEQLRRRLDGVAVARLEAGRCTGCHLALPAVELDALRRAPADAVVRHEECGRILAR